MKDTKGPTTQATAHRTHAWGSKGIDQRTREANRLQEGGAVQARGSGDLGLLAFQPVALDEARIYIG